MSHVKKKFFGQHFLHDAGVIGRIADAVPTDGRLVIEIGPGEGALTALLFDRLQALKLVEADADLIEPLTERFGDIVTHEDAAKVDFRELTSEEPWILVGNLPYNAAAAIMRNALESHTPEEAVIMVQKEQGERMRAKPGDMSLLSLSIQLYMQPKLLFHVGRGAFSPPPNVDSSVLHLTKKETDGREESIMQLAKIGFSSRRKQLAKLLSQQLKVDANEIKDLLQKLQLSPTIRAQELSIEDWRRLEKKISK